MLTAERAHELFTYDEDTGVLRWRIDGYKRSRQQAGKIAGCCRPDGYWKITVEHKHYRRARIIWLLKTGKWPSPEVDHKDRNPANDRWGNLREATSSEQKANRATRKDSKTGIKGIQFRQAKGKFVARIRGRHLGYFATAEDANVAYREAAELEWGSFCR